MKKIFLLIILTGLFLTGCNINQINNTSNTNDNTNVSNQNKDVMEKYVNKNVKDNIYTNPKYGWTFKVPNIWEGKYYIEDSKTEENTTYFYYLPSKDYSGYLQNFFKITVVTKEVYNRSKDDPDNRGPYFIGDNERYVLSITFPIEVGGLSKEDMDEYMKLSTRDILNRLTFPK